MKSRPRRRHAPAFTLLEMIGVMAVLSILAAVLLPNTIRKITAAHAGREEQNLEVLAQGFRGYVASHQTVPGGASWEAALAQTTGLNLHEVRYVTPADTNSARIYLVHPGFTPSTGLDPVFTLASGGAAAPTNARVLILSTTKSTLTLPVTSGKAPDTPAHRTAFENIWNWNFDPATQSPPEGWPAEWTHNGEYLHLVRLNLAPLFHHVTFSNTRFPAHIPFARFNQLAPVACDFTNAVDAFYPQGTVIRLYKHDSPHSGPATDPDDLDLTHIVERDVNFLYDGAAPRWSIP
jgi:prepilin-type N-terminal cleavage/methylation domain-containing protein